MRRSSEWFILSEGMMGLFLLQQVHANEHQQMLLIQHLGSQDKNSDDYDNGNGDKQKDSDHAL